MSTRLSFNRLTPTEFEEFCHDLLQSLRFANLDWRKGTGFKTSPADKGRDIVCQKLLTDLDGSQELETWFVDCKHYKKGVPASELQNALAWANSERPAVLLFIASNFLSNSAKEYLENSKRNNRPQFKIKYWERPLLEKLTRKKATLIRRYDLAKVPIRSVRAILKAEEMLLDKRWYDRHMSSIRAKSHIRDKWSPELLRAARAAARAVEKKYGKKRLGPHTDFEWGALFGKHSAIRWVLGDEWDNGDT